MPVILPSEKGQLRSRLVYFVLYASLALGSLTMVYPFLLMASGSFKSRVDVQELDLVPRFIHDDTMLFRKYVEAKYSERIEEYRSATGDGARNFYAIDATPRGRLRAANASRRTQELAARDRDD